MLALRNARWELFAQEIANGVRANEAYVTAGFEPNSGNARRLRGTEAVAKRIEALLIERDQMARQATEKAIEALALTKERVLSELAKIAFANVTDAVKWGAALALKDSETGEAQIAQGVELIESADLPPNVTAAISEVRKTKEGISIKFHDKLGALEKIGKELGMFIDRKEVRHGRTLEELIIASYNRDGRSEEPVLIEARADERS